MTDADATELEQELERERRELRQSLDEDLETTIRRAWFSNSVVWLGVTLGAFALNLLVLALIAG